jgi:hypothetical protein
LTGFLAAFLTGFFFITIVIILLTVLLKT